MPEESPGQDQGVSPLVREHARALLAALAQTGKPPDPVAALQIGQGWSVVVIAFPTPARQAIPPGLSECDRDCLVLLAQAPQPVPASRIRKELEAKNIAI